MIKVIEDNMAVECINLMNKSYEDNDYVGYDKNEAGWINHFLSVLNKVREGSPHHIAICDVDTEGKVQGFMLCATFKNYYTGEYVMDVKDCIVDHDNSNNIFIVKRMFDYMMEHIQAHGGKHWRADSIRAFQDCERYAEFLKRFYNAEPSLSMRGQIGD